ncbi:hypothetical protein ABTK60_19755, partial [Acinetobacter baumannii]
MGGAIYRGDEAEASGQHVSSTELRLALGPVSGYWEASLLAREFPGRTAHDDRTAHLEHAERPQDLGRIG